MIGFVIGFLLGAVLMGMARLEYVFRWRDCDVSELTIWRLVPFGRFLRGFQRITGL